MKNNNKLLLTTGLVLATLLTSTISTSAYAVDEKWKVRFRGIGIIPDDSSNNITANGTTGLGAGVEVNEAFVPEFDITYMITPHWGVEAIAGIAKHDVSIEGNDGVLLSGLGINDGFEIFDTWVLPPTVTLQYHFMPQSNIRPYVGVGINYTATLFDDATEQLEAILGPVDVSTSNSWGYALQAGLDYDINDSWFFNVDVKYIDINTTAKLGFTGGNLEVDLDINPFVVGAGVGYRF